jgi:tRNA G18 (ribose-2'-O)-methylase SpoU
MPIIPIDDLGDARVAEYRTVPDPELLEKRGLFVAEGRLVVRRLLQHDSYRVGSLLVNRAALESLRDLLTGRPSLPVYVCPSDALVQIVGFDLHRGCVALVQRPPARAPAEVCRDARLLLVLEAVTNADNVGGAFRNAAAFGASGVLLSPTCCDPLYRKAIRTSMGAVLRVPYARIADWPGGVDDVRREGLTLVALTPRVDATDISTFAVRDGGLDRVRRLALLIGTEGDGLSQGVEALADERVRIPIDPSIDSLNLATAAGIALHRLAALSGGPAGL